MKATEVTKTVKGILDQKKIKIQARLFVTREDGITIYDSVQDSTTSSVAALVSGMWQASEALMGLVHKNQEPMDFRLGFDTSSHGITLFPLKLSGKKYFMGAIYENCLNPAQLKRQVSLIKSEIVSAVPEKSVPQKKIELKGREGFLFQDISDEEIDRLFSLGGI